MKYTFVFYTFGIELCLINCVISFQDVLSIKNGTFLLNMCIAKVFLEPEL